MADFAPNYTPRYKITYSSLGATHTMQFRLPRSFNLADLGAIQGKIAAFLGALNDVRYDDWTVLGASFAAVDSDIFLPAGAPAVAAGTVVSTGVAAYNKALHLSFPARSAAGLRGILYLYGVSFAGLGLSPEIDDFRVTSVEDASVGSAVNALNASPEFYGNDNEVLSWYEYANWKYNDHWLRVVRKGG